MTRRDPATRRLDELKRTIGRAVEGLERADRHGDWVMSSLHRKDVRRAIDEYRALHEAQRVRLLHDAIGLGRAAAVTALAASAAAALTDGWARDVLAVMAVAALTFSLLARALVRRLDRDAP